MNRKEAKSPETAEIIFTKQFNGYNREEVDCYVQNLARAYQNAYEEYNDVNDKYNALVEQQKAYDAELEEYRQSKANAAIISKTLVDTEAFAQKIIANAHAEAARIKTTAQSDSQKILENAYVERAAAKIEAQNLVNDARAEVEKISIQAKRNLEVADSTVKHALSKLEDFMTAKQTEYAGIKDTPESYFM